jgi:hypothetical protein
MTTRLLVTLFVAGLASAAAQSATAQSAADRPAPIRLAQARAVPPVVAEDEISPRQIQQENRRPTRPPRTAAPAAQAPAGSAAPAAPAAPRPAAAAPKPAAAATPASAAAAAGGAPVTGAAQPAAARTGGAPRTIACSGVFGRESTHLKLAIAFDSKNLVYTEVDGPEGTKLNASVLFPNDAKRRLEVLWQNEAARADTSLIVIGGQSQWSGPKGLRIGMPITALEKANGKPFSLSGLDQDNGGSVLDWKGGAMSTLPGGCKVGVRVVADPKAKDDARAAAAGKELASNDAALKPARLTVSEIIIGY